MTHPRLYRGLSAEDRRRDRRERFLAAAVALFGTDGYAATSVSAVCREAGLSSRQFYEEFSDREDLLRAVYDVTEDGAMRAVEAAVRDAMESTDRLEVVLDAGIGAFIDHFAADTRLTRICFVEVVGVSRTFEDHRARRRRGWADLLGGVATGGVQRGLLDAETDPLLWVGFIGAVNSVIVAQAESDDLSAADALRVLRTLLQSGVFG
ncbi:TetR/AcrR family transcriptional regulator [Gordonia shandongensis]|uniref:TetR/AcrR family transcriptional regulator n=1 Tax=Gordonia shandongensis TaxID=376351 RepID=UPI0004065B52|nr:TetR/AcrR family transcriptional regulator [Gordonia shandongensis]